MYKRVIVPLDGSDLAEEALPHLQEIASGCRIPEIILVSVTEPLAARVRRQTSTLAVDGHVPTSSRPPTLGNSTFGVVYTPDLSALASMPTGLGKMGKTAFLYLTRVAARLDKAGLKASTAVLVGNPAEEILRFARNQEADLIVIASRGKSGFSRWDLGNVADKIIRGSETPVFVVKPKPGFKETKRKRRGEPS
jgi:nucleotide-binding universal stress UspA family protein